MDKDQILDNIFNDDPDGLLAIKPKISNARTADERLVSSFQEINDFYSLKGKEPKANPINVSESLLYFRLKNLREDEAKIKILKSYDKYNLLPKVNMDEVCEPQMAYGKGVVLESIEDILMDDDLNLLNEDKEGLFDFKNISKCEQRESTDFVARRKPCNDFEKYSNLFKEVQRDLVEGKRKLEIFNEAQLLAGNFFVHNGIMLLLEKTFEVEKDKFGKLDGRTRVIFENGTESSMKLRSLGKNLFSNGKYITANYDTLNENFIKNFSSITDEDKEVGFIYVLKSKSSDERISSIQDLFKIGYSKIEIKERIKNAEKEPTYLMASVSVQSVWRCYNMNPQKLEQLLHNFFANSCLEIDVFDENGKRHTPREWFIAPIDIIEQAVGLIITGEIVKYKFDPQRRIICER